MRAQEIPDVFLEKSACQGVLTATKALLRSSCEVLLRSYGVLFGDSMRSHGAHIVCTVLSRRSHCAFTAFALCFQGACTECVTYKNVCKYQELQIQPIKPKTAISRNNFMRNLKNSQNTRRTYCHPSKQLFLKKIATQQLKLN